MMMPFHPLIVGIGGTTRSGSSSEKILRLALANAAAEGANIELFAGPQIDLEMYSPEMPVRSGQAKALIAALRRADGIILASPGYHGSISGMLKNALDYSEDMRGDSPPYLDGRAVGLIACAIGWQATGTTLTTMRSIVHALRGWPTPMSVAINTAGRIFNDDGSLLDAATGAQLTVLVGQVIEFARMRALLKSRVVETGTAAAGQQA